MDVYLLAIYIGKDNNEIYYQTGEKGQIVLIISLILLISKVIIRIDLDDYHYLFECFLKKMLWSFISTLYILKHKKIKEFLSKIKYNCN